MEPQEHYLLLLVPVQTTSGISRDHMVEDHDKNSFSTEQEEEIKYEPEIDYETSVKVEDDPAYVEGHSEMGKYPIQYDEKFEEKHLVEKDMQLNESSTDGFEIPFVLCEGEPFDKYANERQKNSGKKKKRQKKLARKTEISEQETIMGEILSPSSVAVGEEKAEPKQNQNRSRNFKKRLTCNECHKQFSCISKMEVHMRVHTGEKPLTCIHCPMTFSDPSSLIRHKRTHTGEKPYTCSQCGRSYAQSNTLKEHMITHTLGKNEKPFKCTECSRAFSSSGALRKHSRIHTGERLFTCTECSRSFTQSNSLTLHMRTHTGEKPFICKECPSSFPYPESLVRHMRTHTGEKPYMCAACLRTFSDPSALKRHTRTHDGSPSLKQNIDKTNKNRKDTKMGNPDST